MEKLLKNIEDYFAIHMPGYRCTPICAEDGGISLQFICLETNDAITVCGITAEQINSEAAIKKLSKTLSEEFSLIVKQG